MAGYWIYCLVSGCIAGQWRREFGRQDFGGRSARRFQYQDFHEFSRLGSNLCSVRWKVRIWASPLMIILVDRVWAIQVTFAESAEVLYVPGYVSDGRQVTAGIVCGSLWRRLGHLTQRVYHSRLPPIFKIRFLKISVDEICRGINLMTRHRGGWRICCGEVDATANNVPQGQGENRIGYSFTRESLASFGTGWSLTGS